MGEVEQRVIKFYAERECIGRNEEGLTEEDEELLEREARRKEW